MINNKDGSLMVFGQAMRKMPFELVAPFNEIDLMVFISPEIGFRICNIATEDGKVFGIKEFMSQEQEIFGKIPFNDRLKDFAEILQGRVERFFITKKNDYIFFDLEEQKKLRQAMSMPGLSCTVEILRFYKDKSPTRINFLEIDKKEINTVLRFLGALRVRAVMTCGDYYHMANEQYTDSKQRRSKYEDIRKKRAEDETTILFNRYKKLKTLKSKKSVNLYFKKLKIKYHPDRPETGDAVISPQIQCDHDEIKKTRWYINLPEEVTNES